MYSSEKNRDQPAPGTRFEWNINRNIYLRKVSLLKIFFYNLVAMSLYSLTFDFIYDRTSADKYVSTRPNINFSNLIMFVFF